VLYVFNPNILAHSNLVTTDLGAAFGTFVAIAAISIYLKEWKRKFFIYSILAVAFAFLAKFSAIVVLPILFLLPLTNYLLESKKSDSLKTGRKLFQDYLRLATIFLFAFLIVYCFYLLLLLRTPNQIYVQNIKEVFPGNRYNLQTIFSQAHILFRPIIYYIAGFLYATGHTIGGHLSFFLGNLSMTGNVLYFPIIFVLKNQIVFLPLFLFGLVLAIREKKGELLLLGLMAFFFLYMIVSMKSSLNIGIRHLLPIFPAAIIFSALALEKTSKYFKGLITYIVLVLYILPVLLTFPHYISYANKIVPQDQKYKYFGDSSLDWGQGLKDLKSYAEKNNLETLRVDYFGGGAPVNYYLPKATVWHYKDGIPEDGYIAISVTTLQFVGYYPEGKGYFEYFYNKKPYAEVSGVPF
jgi:hypothetical protein